MPFVPDPPGGTQPQQQGGFVPDAPGGGGTPPQETIVEEAARRMQGGGGGQAAESPSFWANAAKKASQTVAEPIFQMGTGLGATAAGAAAGIYAGMNAEDEAVEKYHATAGQAFDQGWAKMKDVFHQVQQQYTYSQDPNNFWSKQTGLDPESQRGANVAKAVGYLPGKAVGGISTALKWGVAEPTARAAESLGVSPETAQRIRTVGQDVSDIAAPFALGPLGRAVGAAGEATGISARVGAAAERFNRGLQPAADPALAARQAGYYIPEGPLAQISGRRKLDEGLSRRHEVVNNRNARESVGLAGNHPVEPAELERVRADAHADRAAVRGTYGGGWARGLSGDVQRGLDYNHRIINSTLSENIRNADQWINTIEDPAVNALQRRNLQGSLMRDARAMQQRALGLRTAQEMHGHMIELRGNWDRMRNEVNAVTDTSILTPAQIRTYVGGMIGRNIADVLQTTLDEHMLRTDPELAAQWRAAGERINNSYVIEDSRLPNGNISAQLVLQAQQSGRQITGGLQPMADMARYNRSLVQDLGPAPTGLFHPMNFIGRLAQTSLGEKFRVANQMLGGALGLGAVGVGGAALVEGWIHKALPTTALAATAAAVAARAAMRRVLMGHVGSHRIVERAERRTAARNAPAYTPRQPRSNAAIGTGALALSEMDDQTR
jgi:hypothetical protein